MHACGGMGFCFCFNRDACLLPLRKQITAKREELSYITSNSKRTDNYDYSERVRY
jgi:hypothetical protein